MTTRTLVQALSELVHPDLRHAGLVLDEEQAKSFPPVTLNRRGQALVLRPDRLLHVCERPDCHARGAVNARLFPFFVAHRQGLTSLCDYLLFYEPRGSERSTVFLVELKSGGTSGSWNQIRNGKVLAEYLLAMTSLHGESHARPPHLFSRRRLHPQGAPAKTWAQRSAVRFRARYKAPGPLGRAPHCGSTLGSRRHVRRVTSAPDNVRSAARGSVGSRLGA